MNTKIITAVVESAIRAECKLADDGLTVKKMRQIIRNAREYIKFDEIHFHERNHYPASEKAQPGDHDFEPRTYVTFGCSVHGATFIGRQAVVWDVHSNMLEFRLHMARMK